MAKHVFVTASGVQLRLRPISPFLLSEMNAQILKKLEEEGLVVECPTYETKTATGIVEVLNHDATTISTPEEKEAWGKYQDYITLMSKRLSESSLKIMMLKGTENCEVPPEWVAEREWMGLAVPTNPLDQKLEYLQTEVFNSVADMKRFFVEVVKLSSQGAPAETITALEKSFQRALEGDPAGEPAAG